MSSYEVSTSRTITVSGVKPSTSEDTVTLYFESKRAANVDVDHIKYDEERKVYTITFKETVDISELLRKSHKIEGATLSVQIYTPPKCYPNKVLIKGINPQTSDDNLSNFLEARTKEDVKNIEFSNRESGKAIVTFGNTANVTVIDKKIKERMLESCRLSAHSVPESQCIVVRGFSQNCSRYTLEYYFDNKKRSGVEGVEDVKMDKQGRYCLVFFTDAETALKASEKQHTVDNHVLDVKIYHDCLGLSDSSITASVTSHDLSDNSRVGVISEPEPLIVEGIDKRKLEFVNSSEGYKQTFEKQLRKFDGKVDWDSRKLPESLVIQCSRIKGYNRDWTYRIKDEVKKVFDSLLVMEISLDINVWPDVMNKVRSINVPDPSNVSLVQEKNPDYKLIVVGDCTAVQQLFKILQRIVTDVNNEISKKLNDFTYTRQLKYFEIKILGVVEFQSQASKRFNTVSVSIDEKNQKIAFSGPEEQIHEVKLFLYETLEKIESKLLPGRSQLFIKFIEDHTISQTISEALQQRNVKGIWIAENDDVTVYALSIPDANTVASILEDSVQECSFKVEKWQASVLNTFEYSNFISLLVDEYRIQSITVKVGNNRDRVTILTTKRHHVETIREKVRRFLEDHGEQEFHVTLSPDKSKLFQELMKTQIAELSEELKDRDVTFTIQEDGILLKGKSEDFVLAKSKLEPLLTCVSVVADNPKFHKVVKRIKKKGELRQVSAYDDESESSDDGEDGSHDHSPRLRFHLRGKQERFKAAGGQEVVVVKSDITDLEVDVIVSGSNRDLEQKGGLGKVIVNKGGRSIEDECRERVNQFGQLNEADVFCSKSGDLKSRMIVHAVSPVWKDGKQGERDKLITCVELALAATEKNKLLTIAIPALGTGGFRFPSDISTNTVVRAIRDYFKWHPSSSVRAVCLCDIVGDTVLNFTKACQMYFSDQSSSPSGDTAGGRKRVLSGNIEIKLVQGQLSNMKVGAIVNTTSKDLNLEQGIVSASLLKAGGSSLQQECRSKYPQGINFGDFAVTTGGNMKCQIVLHGCLQQWRGDGAQKQNLEKFVMSCLTEANKQKCSSIAFPAMGTGKLGYPPEIVAHLMYSCVYTFAIKNNKSTMKEVLFVLYHKDYKTVKAFEEEEKRKTKSEDVISERIVSTVVYKRMTDEEKKETFQEAFDAKKASEMKLRATKEEMRKKEKKLYDLQAKISDRKLFMPGEKEALEKNTVKYFDLLPERSYQEGSAAQTHFRLAESQFYRLMAGRGGSFSVTKVQYVVNPQLVKNFNKTRERLKKQRGDKLSQPILVFHGTQETNIKSIVENNFKLPGSQGFHHKSGNTGAFGRGVYFSEYPNYSMGYISGAQMLLMSQILPGKIYNCPGMMLGAPLQNGFDSHLSPDGNEWVIYEADQILPFYIVHYKSGAFAY